MKLNIRDRPKQNKQQVIPGSRIGRSYEAAGNRKGSTTRRSIATRKNGSGMMASKCPPAKATIGRKTLSSSQTLTLTIVKSSSPTKKIGRKNFWMT